jgi:capsular polysaccharide biosynthesis protein
MDLISIAQALWRHKLAAILVIVLTALASFYVVWVRPAVYEASSSILLINPPTSATQSQVAADHKLRKASPYNTFAGYGTLSVIAQAVIDNVTSVSAQADLVKSGVDPHYQVALSAPTDEPAALPIIDITNYGATARRAIAGMNLITEATRADLFELQAAQGINSFYMVKAVNLVAPVRAQKSMSGKIRALVAVLGLGVILLLIVVSISDALDKRRRDPWSHTYAPQGRTPLDAADPRAMDSEPVRVNHGSRPRH